jgi:hypothetical protein
MIQAAQAYVEKVGRVASVLAVPAPGGATLLLDADLDAIAALLASVLPGAVAQSSRLLWVDPERLTERLNAALKEQSQLIARRRHVTEGIVQAIAKEVSAKRQVVSPYAKPMGGRAAPTASHAATAITLNSVV